jgi:hypothetical protein
MIQVLEPLKVGDSHTSSISKHVWDDQYSAVMEDSLSSNGSRSIGSFSNNLLIGVYLMYMYTCVLVPRLGKHPDYPGIYLDDMNGQCPLLGKHPGQILIARHGKCPNKIF